MKLTQIQPPPELEFRTVDGIAIVVQKFPAPGSVMVQHKHDYDHGHFVAAGSVRLWVDDTLVGDFSAPTLIPIEANRYHRLMALEPGTIGLCIHNLHGRPGISIADLATLDA